MKYTPRKTDIRNPDSLLFDSIEPVIRGLKMSLIELNVFRSRSKNPGGVQVRAVIYRGGITGLEDCSKAHRAILPRLELAFPGQEVYLEVSSPGIDRLIKDGCEFAFFTGQGIRCYRTDISDWTEGILIDADGEKITLELDSGEIVIPLEIIAKARLSAAINKI